MTNNGSTQRDAETEPLEPYSNDAVSHLSARSPSSNKTKYQRLQSRLIEIEIVKTKDMDFKQRLWYILTRFDYMVFMFCMTCLFVVVTGIQFWITDYFIIVMGVERSYAYKLYFFMGAVGPVFGIILCALLFDRIGGYTSQKAIPVCGLFGIGGMIFGLASTLIGENAQLCALCIMMELFCGAFVMPACTGIMLNQVPPNLRTMANSVANFSYNLFGYLPAPVLYGFFYTMGDCEHNHYGLIAIQMFTVMAFCGFTVAYYRDRLVQRKYMHLEDFNMINIDGTIYDKLLQAVMNENSSEEQ